MSSEPLDAREVGARLDTHEAVCAERYKNLESGIKSIQSIMVAVGGAVLVEVLAGVGYLLIHTLGH